MLSPLSRVLDDIRETPLLDIPRIRQDAPQKSKIRAVWMFSNVQQAADSCWHKLQYEVVKQLRSELEGDGCGYPYSQFYKSATPTFRVNAYIGGMSKSSYVVSRS
jgi:hypothetical protein